MSATDAYGVFPAAKYPLIKKENNFSTALNGSVGPDKNTKSLIKIRSTAGKLVIQ